MDKAAFKHIFDNQFDNLRRFIYYRCGDEELASDIAQDVFMRVWEKRNQLATYNLKALLYKIANDMVISDYRKRVNQLDFSKSMVAEKEIHSPHEELQFTELQQRYSEALAKLPENQRTTFLMSRNDELKHHEIADRLDLSVKAVEKRMSAALVFLKEKLL